MTNDNTTKIKRQFLSQIHSFELMTWLKAQKDSIETNRTPCPAIARNASAALKFYVSVSHVYARLPALGVVIPKRKSPTPTRPAADNLGMAIISRELVRLQKQLGVEPSDEFANLLLALDITPDQLFV